MRLTRARPAAARRPAAGAFMLAAPVKTGLLVGVGGRLYHRISLTLTIMGGLLCC